ncbi:hypothetical protein M422DRAFT_53383 [Sphaerobolus stellatus SS14]|uniref:DUF6533 domain-containing protein n=1 Tax=Sphaerobolus stellatus (strain SS14) TaxID=990650 RepID=A0A0C9V1M2_SPHS4|nr:hypothetical protein M422DRAFT_53383 [Sphaerobolus stellatus SS14]
MTLDIDRLFSGNFAFHCSVTASLAFLLYDHIITLDSEVRKLFMRFFLVSKKVHCLTVWFSSTLKPKFDHTNIDHDGYSSCGSFFYASGAGDIGSFAVAEVILQTRIYAMYDCNIKIAFLTGSLFIIEKAVSLLLLYRQFFKGVDINPELPRLLGCSGIVGGHSLQNTLAWLPVVVFESVMIGMTLYKAYQLYEDGTRQPLLRLIIRDRVFSTVIMNFFISLWAPYYLIAFGLGWLSAVPCVVGSRLLLHMHEQAFGRQLTFPELQTHGELHGPDSRDSGIYE